MIRLPDALSASTLVYLAAPSIVFLLGWLELPLGLAAVVLVAVALRQLVRQLPQRPTSYSAFALIFLLGLAAIWNALGGAGHLVYSNIDWGTRDTVYADFILTSWPPSYGMHEGAHLVLRTAMGYFLPPAALAKLLGIEWATMILLAWTSTGVWLFLLLLPLPSQFGWRMVLLALIAVFFSGMDYLGTLAVHGHVPIFPLPLEWWRQWTFSSLTAQLFWAPNHALGLWLGAALLFRHRHDAALPSLAVGTLPLLLLWTPFAVAGLLPWFAWGIWHARQQQSAAIRQAGPVQWLSGIVLVAIVGGLFARQGVSAAFASQFAPAGAAGQLGRMDLDLVLGYIQFVGCEFMILALLLAPFVGTLRREFVFAVGLLLCIPLLRFGPSNDWALRVSTPSLVILMIVTMKVLSRHLNDGAAIRRQIPLLLILSIGAITPAFEFARAILWRHTPPNYGESLLENQSGFLAPHYIGRLDSAALQFALRRPGRVPNARERLALVPAGLRRRQ